jgi:CheY-like chemotaxis protein
MGSGLCDNYNMVISAGGAIWFHNQRSGGTEFHVLFPVRNKDYHINEKGIDTGEMQHGTEKILFVDDEEDLTMMAKKMLESLGYSVQCQTNGEDALHEYLDNPGSYDLIITDQSMPGMTGSQMTQKIRESSYTVPVILCTGYSAKITEENWRKSGIDGFVVKPFRKKDIARMIRDILDTSAGKKEAAKN